MLEIKTIDIRVIPNEVHLGILIKSLISPFREDVSIVDLHLSTKVSVYSILGELPLILALIVGVWNIKKLRPKNNY